MKTEMIYTLIAANTQSDMVKTLQVNIWIVE